MAKISKYAQDADVIKSDRLLGSDTGGSTKNFSLESISDFCNDNIITAAIVDGGLGFATADQIHTFVTTQTDVTAADTTGNAATATLAALASTVTITDKSSSNNQFDVLFGNSINEIYDDTGALYYNPSTEILTATEFFGSLTGNASGTAATVTEAAQTNITSLGTLTALTVDNVTINGSTIGHTSDTDLITVASGLLTVAGNITLAATKSLKFADDKIIIGSTNSTLGAQAVSIGLDADSTGAQAVGIGYNPQATGNQSIAIGYNPTASGTYSAAFGYNVTASGTNTFVFGTSGSFSDANTFIASGMDMLARTSDGAILKLQTSDTTVEDGGVLGSIQFSAPLEDSGTDAILVGAEIVAVAEGTFAADNNATELLFKVGASEVATTALTIASTKKATFAGDVIIAGDFEVTGTTTTVNQTNLDVSDNIIGLNRGATSNINDSGIIIERGGTGDNAAILWDESKDEFIVGTTTATPSSTGNLTITEADFRAANATFAGTLTTTGVINVNTGDGYQINGKPWASMGSDLLTLGDWDGEDFATRIMGGLGEVMRVTGNKVGIGTASPVGKLHVSIGSGNTYPAPSSNADILVLDNKSAGGGVDGGMTIFTDNGAKGNIYFGDEQSNQVTGIVSDNTTSNADLYFTTNGDNERLRIKGDGKVGIGTASPDKKLDITVGANDDGIILQVDGRKALELIVDSGVNGQGMLNFYTGTSLFYGRINANSEGLNFDTIANRHMIFKKAGVEKMRIDSSGNVGIGTTDPGAKLHVAGNIQVGSGQGIGYDPTTGGNNANIYFNSAGLTTFAGTTQSFSGNVGIGTASPDEQLTIAGPQSGDVTLTLWSDAGDDSNDGIRFKKVNSSSGPFNIETSKTSGLSGTPGWEPRFTILNSGNVGIGTTSPTQKLHIDGNTLISGEKYHYFGGTSTGIGSDAVGHMIIKQALADKNIYFKADDGSGGVVTYIKIDGLQGYTQFDKMSRHMDSVHLQFGSSGDATIFHDGNDWEFKNQKPDGDINFRADDGTGSGTTTYFSLNGGIVKNRAFKDIHFSDNVKASFGDITTPDLEMQLTFL